MRFAMKLAWAVPTKHVRVIHLRGNQPRDLEFKGFFIYESGETIETDAAIACCIKNFQGDATNPDLIMYTPTVNYSVEVSGDVILETYGRNSLKGVVLDLWLDSRYDYDRAREMLSGDMSITEFFS